MKILHTADLHLGVRFKNVIPRPKYDNYQAIDLEMFVNNKTLLNLEKAVKYAVDRKVDVFIIAGDIFETIDASLEYHTEFIRRLMPLVDNGIKTLVIGGNHDYIRSFRRRVSLALLEDLGYKEIIFKSRVDIKNDFKMDRPLEVDLKDGKIGIILLPYFWTLKREYSKYVKKYIESMLNKVDNVDLKILVAHLDALGARYREDDFIGSYRIIEKVPLSNLHPEKFDYIALGHIHMPQKVGYHHVWYSGSLNRLNFGECNHEKAFILVDLGRDIKVNKISVDPVKMYTFSLKLDTIRLNWRSIRERLDTLFNQYDIENGIVKLILKVRTSGDYRSIMGTYGDKIREVAWSYGVAGLYIKPDITKIYSRKYEETLSVGDAISIEDALEKYIETLSYDKEFKSALYNKALNYLGLRDE